MKKILVLLLILLAVPCLGKGKERRAQVLLKTSMGDIRIELYNETPLHRDNFLNKVREGKYDGLLFHRVIKDFMNPENNAKNSPLLSFFENNTKSGRTNPIVLQNVPGMKRSSEISLPA